MCGIWGFVGKPKNGGRESVFDLMTELAIQTEVRGSDATGYVGFDDAEGLFVTAKAPIKSGTFIRSPYWLKLKDVGIPSTFIGHCRQASVGKPTDNMNNHPFFSKDEVLAFVHNGTIKEHRSVAANQKIDLQTDCDSEVLLRIIEKAKNPMEGIGVLFNQVFELFHREGACVLFDSKARMLYLFRNQAKPLHIARIPQLDDSVVFASTKTILAKSLYRVLGIRDARIFEAVVGRVYKVNFDNGVQRPKIMKEDIVIRRAVTGDYFQTSLPTPIRAARQTTSTVGPIDGGPIEVECPCGSFEFVWPDESRKTCEACAEYELTPGGGARRIYEPVVEDLYVEFKCEECKEVFKQRRIIPTAECPECGSTWVTGIGVFDKNNPTGTVAPGIWECMDCGICYIAVKSPTCNKCKKIKMKWLGEVGRPTLPMTRDEQSRPTEVIPLCKHCKGCNELIPDDGPSRCTKCAEIRRLRRKLERYEGREEE